jgi:hypothetical protein
MIQRLETKGTGVRLLAGKKIFFLRNVVTGPGIHPDCWRGPFKGNQSDRPLNLTTQIPVVLMLMSLMAGVMPLYPLYAFNARVQG